MQVLRSALAAALVSCAIAGSAAAMPADHLGATVTSASSVQKAVLVCGRYRCWRRPGVRYYYHHPRWVCGPYRCWRRW